MNAPATDQLTLDVQPHSQLAKVENPILAGSLKISGTFNVPKDLNGGDEVTVHVADADGQVVATGVCVVGMPGFKEIKLDGDVIGTERVHTAKVA